jgi:hypothetical protein
MEKLKIFLSLLGIAILSLLATVYVLCIYPLFFILAIFLKGDKLINLIGAYRDGIPVFSAKQK